MSVSRKITPAEEVGIGKVFMNGRSQAIRLPKAFRFKGDEVRVRRVPEGVLLEEMPFDVDAWFALLDSYGPSDLERPEQPPMPPIKALFD